ncbi:MAG: glycerophosphodiester phosphodiesterase [Gallionellales bacterium 35-53-114]|jgi:glycerophosphoryl diester phosphodiesterase|nr:MAG: glycerophosphodiester phosphodiesterase [Gallionellales bacterium 35-53-114]OYZ65266.1 MAG: glycerophosphodiester phosphodiesterase [Gallionellales bacterium 24-53-125]OZB08172.1 MAG: glycerophosphodiester phosphodiesterase [Gallionellales bacterium 39-52-133]
MNPGRHTLIFAHRGANKEAPENTRSAFDKALSYPIDGMETDIQLSRDAVPVLWHDRFLAKLGHPTKHIDDYDYSQLQAMNFAQHFSPAARPEGIMKLQEYLDAYRSHTRLLLEIKNRDWESRERQHDKVRQTLAQVGQVSDDRIIISSFNLDSLIYAQQVRPGFPLVYNFENEQTRDDAMQVLAVHPFLHGLCLPIASLDAAMVKLLRGLNKSIAVYTCNSDEEINTALQLGVDILISDVPQKALHMRDQKNEA